MKLKLNLLLNVLENPTSSNKYSKSYLNLKNVMDLEKRGEYKFNDTSVIDKFDKIEKSYLDFINKIPLNVVERYFNDNHENPNKHAYLEYNDNELSDIKIMEIYNKLELFFQDCFSLACLIADLYNFEVKFNEGENKNKSSENNYI